MRYLSTRAAPPQTAARSFEDVLLAGLAEDGGLYVPDRLPALESNVLRGYSRLPYAALAARIMTPFAGDTFATDELRAARDAGLSQIPPCRGDPAGAA